MEPEVLAGAIAEVLASAGVDEVVGRGQLTDAHLDAAVVTIDLREGVDADVVIELPDTSGNTGVGRVTTALGGEEVVITGAATILELLDRYCPAVTARRSGEAPTPIGAAAEDRPPRPIPPPGPAPPPPAGS